MKFIKKLLGFESPYSWVKWLRISFAALGLVIAAMPAILFDDYTVGGAILTLILGIPAMLIGIGIAALIGLAVGGSISAKKQRQSREEINATGNEDLQNLDKSRAAAQSSTLAANIAEKVFVGAGIVLVLLVVLNAIEWWVALIIGIALAAVAEAIAIPARKRAERFKSNFSETAVLPLLQSSGLQNIVYHPLRCLEKSAAEDCGLFGTFDRMSGSEYVSAEYCGERFRLSNILLEKEGRRVDGNGDVRTVWTNAAQGTLFAFEGARDAGAPVLIFDKRIRKNGGFATGNEEIDTRFTVCTEDEAAALALLSPSALSGIAAAAAQIKEPVGISFVKNRLYFMIYDRSIFGAAVVGDATLTQQRGEVLADIDCIKTVARNLSTVLKF